MQRNEALLRAMISMASADDKLEDCERQTIREIYLEMTGEPLADEMIDATMAARAAGQYETIAYLKESAAALGRNDREQLITAAYRVLLCDGVIAAGERKKLAEIARAIDMPEIHYKAVLERVAP